MAGRRRERSGPLSRARGLLGSVKRHIRSLRRVIYSGIAAHPAARPHRNWLAENRRLIAATVKEIQELAGGTHHLPAVGPDPSAPVLRVVALANAFLDHVDSRFDEERFVAFLQGAQEVGDLTLGEIWATRPALQLALIERIIATITTGTTGGGEIPVLISSLRALADARWKGVFAQVNVVDRVLARDPAGAYDRMDDDSQQYYRQRGVGAGGTERPVRTGIAEEAVVLAVRVGPRRRHQPRGRATLPRRLLSRRSRRAGIARPCRLPLHVAAVGHRPRLRAADTLLSRRDRDHDGGDPPDRAVRDRLLGSRARSLRPSC